MHPTAGSLIDRLGMVMVSTIFSHPSKKSLLGSKAEPSPNSLHRYREAGFCSGISWFFGTLEIPSGGQILRMLGLPIPIYR
jgi:hypothetical protein